MSTPRPHGSGDSNHLGDVIAGYLQALERGENPDRQALIAVHPRLADELAGYFADLDRMNKLAAPLRLGDPNETTGLEDKIESVLPVVRYLGDYELLDEIARGGMGVVYRARQVSLKRVVALKMILTGQLASRADVQRFHAEAEAAANLDHPNILPIHEVGEHDGQPYFSMKLAEGGSLAGRVAELVARPRDAVALMAAITRAVDFAHRRGVLHRDLKPANVLLDTDGTPYVTDFGLAKLTHAESSLTHTGAVVGTPSYMAPEQARAEKQLTIAADVYSLGAILYELLTGRPPFRAGSAYATIQQVIEQEPDDPRKLNPAVDRDLAAIALRCLAKDPAGRYDSAAELADDLERWQKGEPTKARPLSLPGQAWRWLRRHTAAAATVLVLGVAWGGLSGVAVITAQPEEAPYMAMLAEHAGPFNPLGFAWRIRQSPPAWFAVLALALAMTFTLGWLLRLGTNPRTSRAALGYASVTGLLATLVGFLFIGPLTAVAVADQAEVYHILGDPRPQFFPIKRSEGMPEPMSELIHPDLEHLVRFLPPQERAQVVQHSQKGAWSLLQRQQAESQLRRLLREAQWANRAYAASIGIWLGLWFTVCFYLGLSLASMWAVDYPARTGRPWLARLLCYIELYGPTAVLVLSTLALLGLWLAVTIHPRGAPSLWKFVGPWLALILMVSLSYVGVMRRWHPLVRLTLVAICGALIVASFGWILWANQPR